MDTRKIISFGNSSYVISLPKAWISENKLKKGDVVNLEEKDGEIVLYTGDNGEKKIQPKTVTINIADKDIEMIQTEIISSYLNNYDIMEIRGRMKSESASKVKAILRNLTGIEIIRQDSEKIVAKDLLSIAEISIGTLIRRMDNIVRSMLTDSISSIRDNVYEDVYERDQDVNRLVYLAYRVLRAAMIDSRIAKQLGKKNVEILYEYILIEKLEKVADKSKRVARFLRDANLKEGEKKEVESIYKAIRDCYSDVMKAYYKKDINLALKMENAGAEKITRLNDFIKERQNAHTHMVVEQMKSMTVSVKNIARAVIGMEKNVW